MENILFTPRYTFSDLKHWQDPWELIEGAPFAMTPAPSIEHQNVSGNIHSQLKTLLKNCPHCFPLLPVNWKISEDTVLQPDNMVICFAAQGNYIEQAPSLIFEILSPSTALKDKNIKYDIYQKQGVKYYCIVDPKSQSIEIFQLIEDEFQKLEIQSSVIFDLAHCKIAFDTTVIWS